MKKLFALILATLMLLACVACGAPADTTADVTEAPATDAPETEAPETEAPETEAPETEAPVTEAPVTEAPETEAPATEAPETEAPKTEDGKTYVYNFDFGAGVTECDGFKLVPEKMEFVDGVYKPSADNGNLRVVDNNIVLGKQSVMFEADISFNKLPYKAEGVTNYPLSIISWTGNNGNAFYDWAFKLDDQGNIYIVAVDKADANFKFEIGKVYTIGVLYDTENNMLEVFIDGVSVGGRGYTVKSNMTQSSLRIFDGGAEKAHYDASIHAVRAYLK